MIRVTLEMVSARGPEHDRVLGVGYIANTGVQASPGMWGYTVWLSKTIYGQTKQGWKTGRGGVQADLDLLQGPPDGEVLGFDNVKRGAWDLVFVVLRAVLGARN